MLGDPSVDAFEDRRAASLTPREVSGCAELVGFGHLALDDVQLADQLKQLAGVRSRAEGLEDLAPCMRPTPRPLAPTLRR